MQKIKNHWKKLVLLGILGLAGFFRLYQIHKLPGGLFPDEAANGLDINLMEQGVLQPFYERGNGREALFFYMLWGSVKVFGRSPFAHHLVSALVGILAVLACYLVAKEIFKLTTHNSRIVPYLATFLMAVSSWHVVLSRTAFRANLIPLLASLTLWAMLKTMLSTKWLVPSKDTTTHDSSLSALHTIPYTLYASFFGVFFALGFYTYIAFRIMVPLVAILILWPALAYAKQYGIRKLLQSFWKPVIIAIISFLIVISPIAHYFYTHEGSFVGRSGQVSVFNPELNGGDLIGTILKVTKDSLLGYVTIGDLNFRHNIAGFPFLSPFISPFFVIGLLLCILYAIRYTLSPIRNKHRFPEFLLTGWFFAMLLPVITTAEGIPHGLRAIGTIPTVFIITAYGMWSIYQALSAKLSETGTKQEDQKLTIKHLALRSIGGAYLVFLLIALPVQTYQLYFVEAYNSHEYYHAFRSDLTVVSDYLKTYGQRENTYLILDKFSVQTVDYLTTKDGKTSCDRNEHYRPQNCTDDPKNKPYIQVDPEDSWMPAPSPREGKDGERLTSDNNKSSPYTYGLKPGDKIVFTESSLFDIKKFKQYHPNVKLAQYEKNHLGRYIMAVYVIR